VVVGQEGRVEAEEVEGGRGGLVGKEGRVGKGVLVGQVEEEVELHR
jgi:hypothetical protein